MDDRQKEEFNLQIRKLLKEFGVKSHQAIQKNLAWIHLTLRLH